jgi:hypothetical protein
MENTIQDCDRTVRTMTLNILYSAPREQWARARGREPGRAIEACFEINKHVEKNTLNWYHSKIN